MVSLTKSTKSIKEKEIKRGWHLIDVKDQILGRTVTKITNLLQAKHKVNSAPYLDFGDYVVVTNAAQVRVTGNKFQDKVYTKYSGYPGGLTKITFRELIKKNPTEVIHHAVSGMLPKNKLRDRRLARLFIYPSERHPYENKFPALLAGRQETK